MVDEEDLAAHPAMRPPHTGGVKKLNDSPLLEGGIRLMGGGEISQDERLMQLISDKLAELMSQQVAAITKQVTSQVTDKVQRLLALVETSVPYLSSIPTPPPKTPTRKKQPPPSKEKAPPGKRPRGRERKRRKERVNKIRL